MKAHNETSLNTHREHNNQGRKISVAPLLDMALLSPALMIASGQRRHDAYGMVKLVLGQGVRR